MNDLNNIKYWLFDLDNTLYDGATKVFEQVDKKMTKFISEKAHTHGSLPALGHAKNLLCVLAASNLHTHTHSMFLVR